MEMNKETIEKIEEMSKLENKTIEVDGKVYSLKELHEVKPRRSCLQSIESKSLIGFVDYVKHMITNHNDKERPLPVIIQVSANGVKAKTGLINELERDTIAEATPSTIDASYGRYKSLEETIIALQTKFVRTDVVDSLLETLKCMVIDNTVAVEDDGVSQRVTVANGAGIRSEIKLSPIVRLKPYTTFRELEQPDRLFLLRVDKHGDIALFEADGDCYKQKIIETTRDYLGEAFAEEMSEGIVILA